MIGKIPLDTLPGFGSFKDSKNDNTDFVKESDDSSEIKFIRFIQNIKDRLIDYLDIAAKTVEHLKQREVTIDMVTRPTVIYP